MIRPVGCLRFLQEAARREKTTRYDRLNAVVIRS
jgi:hypothetical protein